MSAHSPAEAASYEVLAPTATGPGAINTVVATGAAQSIDLNAAWGGFSNRLTAPGVQAPTPGQPYQAPRGGAFFTVQPLASPVTFVVSPTATTAVTATTGVVVAAGERFRFWVPAGAPFLDLIGTAAANVLIWQSSRNEAKQT